MAQHEPATEDQMKERLSIVRDLLIKGMPKADIVKTCQKDYAWGVVDRSIYYYIQDVWKELNADAPAVDRRAYYALTVQQLDIAIGKAIADGNLKAINDLLQTRIRLMKLDTPQADEWEQEAIKAGFNPADVQRLFLQSKAEPYATAN